MRPLIVSVLLAALAGPAAPAVQAQGEGADVPQPRVQPRARPDAAPVPDELCRWLTRHVPGADVAYEPGVDAQGRAVAPADLGGGFDWKLPEILEFDIAINPIGFTELRALSAERAALEAAIAAADAPVDADEQRAALAAREAELASRAYGETALSLAHVAIDTRSGQVLIDGRPVSPAEYGAFLAVCP